MRAAFIVLGTSLHASYRRKSNLYSCSPYRRSASRRTDRNVQLFQHPDVSCSLILTDGRLAFRTTICLNATHMQRDVNALCEKATGFVTEHGPVNLDLMTACTQGVSSQDNGTNRFIVVLDRIDKGDF